MYISYKRNAKNITPSDILRYFIQNNNFGSQLPDGRYVISEDELEEIKEMKRLKKEISKLRQNYEIEKGRHLDRYQRSLIPLSTSRVLPRTSSKNGRACNA